MKRLNTILSIVMGVLAGAFLGRGICVAWSFKAHPEMYAMNSAPWYTGILVEGSVTLVVLLICLTIKAILKHKFIKSDSK